ncbi:hypothetical protein HXX76_010341 [Chlamydomonas incerta]|uniref:Uncharacterized protein n=1 Tax=Chlamydomonas incerta TaxID=51695 RepID=A0A835VY73_CHLIN|nr:hypothetical protein HXX76_010341 [Chlamydomonas incerta]|eukprot:KAG2430243.1 hypothetical protein HXX76_010341 [Chlamydomonas incerta]
MASPRLQSGMPSDLIRAAQFSDTTIGTSTLAGESSIPSSSALSVVQPLSPQASAHPHARALAKQASVNRSRTAIQALHEANETLRNQAEALATAAEEEVHMPSEQATTAAVQRFLSRRMSRNASRNSRGATASGARQASMEAAAVAALAAVPAPGAAATQSAGDAAAAAAPAQGVGAAEVAVAASSAGAATVAGSVVEAVQHTLNTGTAAEQAAVAVPESGARAAAATSLQAADVPVGASPLEPVTQSVGASGVEVAKAQAQEPERAVAAAEAAPRPGGAVKPAETAATAVAAVCSAAPAAGAAHAATNGSHGAIATGSDDSTAARKAQAVAASAPVHAEADGTAIRPNTASTPAATMAAPADTPTTAGQAAQGTDTGGPGKAEEASRSTGRAVPVVQATLASAAAEVPGAPPGAGPSEDAAASRSGPGETKKAKRPGLFACFGR